MIEIEKLERAIRSKQECELRAKAMLDYFQFYGRHLFPWLHSLAEKAKARISMPITPVFIGEYYNDVKDKEVALFSSLLIKDNDTVYEQVHAMREILTDSPHSWLSERGFTVYSLAQNQNKRLCGTFGCTYQELSSFFSNLFDCLEGSLRTYSLGELYRVIGYQSILARADYPIGGFNDRLLLMALGTSGGLGCGLWDVPPSSLRCPVSRAVSRFVRIWFPDKRLTTPFDDAVHAFGFERDCDLFYAMLGWEEMARKNPNECNRMATIYNNWYMNGYKRWPWQWRDLLLPISL